MAGDSTLSVREAASFLGVRTEEVYRLLWEGRLKGLRGSRGRWIITKAALLEHKKGMRKRYG